MSAWHEHPIVVTDFESCGVDPHETMPVQIGMARFEAGELVAKRSALINPGIPIPPEATAIHGISDEMVKSAPPPDHAIRECAEGIVTNGVILCGYNGQSYDRPIWERFAPPMGHWIDPLIMVRRLDRFEPGKGRHRLSVTCKRWGIPLDNAHDALSDCLATGALLFSRRVRRWLGDMSIEELIERQEKRRAEQGRDFQAWLAKQPKRETGT